MLAMVVIEQLEKLVEVIVLVLRFASF